MHRIGRLSLASGNIYVDVIVLSDQGILIKTVSLSGFFLNGDKFVTSGHLLDVEEGTDTQQTIDHLSSSTVDSPRAFVSIRFKTESSSDGKHFNFRVGSFSSLILPSLIFMACLFDSHRQIGGHCCLCFGSRRV